jgi:hypothetical protein
MSTTFVETANSSTKEENDLSQYAFENLKPYVHPPETKEDLPWSELVTLDLEDYNRPGGKERLSKQLEHAVHHVGFVGSHLSCEGYSKDTNLYYTVLRKKLRLNPRASRPSVYTCEALLRASHLREGEVRSRLRRRRL